MALVQNHGRRTEGDPRGGASEHTASLWSQARGCVRRGATERVSASGHTHAGKRDDMSPSHRLSSRCQAGKELFPFGVLVRVHFWDALLSQSHNAQSHLRPQAFLAFAPFPSRLPPVNFKLEALEGRDLFLPCDGQECPVQQKAARMRLGERQPLACIRNGWHSLQWHS